MKSRLRFIAFLVVVVLVGCNQSGPVEKAGERVDEIVDNIKHGDAPLKEKGTMEKLGESVDNSVKRLEKN